MVFIEQPLALPGLLNIYMLNNGLSSLSSHFKVKSATQEEKKKITMESMLQLIELHSLKL